MTFKDGEGKRITVIEYDDRYTTQIYTATTSANAGWFDEYDNNFVTDEFGIDDIIMPVESNYTASKTETFGTSNEFNFENSPKTRRRKPLALAMGRKAAHTSFLDFLFFSNII